MSPILHNVFDLVSALYLVTRGLGAGEKRRAAWLHAYPKPNDILSIQIAASDFQSPFTDEMRYDETCEGALESTCRGLGEEIAQRMFPRNGREAFRVNTRFLTPHLMQLAEPALENALLRLIWWLYCMSSLSTCTFEHLESFGRLAQLLPTTIIHTIDLLRTSDVATATIGRQHAYFLCGTSGFIRPSMGHQSTNSQCEQTSSR